MQKVKIISKILFSTARILGILYLVTGLYSVICLVSNWSIEEYGNGNFIHIFYPFTNRPFLNIDNNRAYILFSFLMPISLYGLFFWLSSNVFKVFYQPKLFTESNVRALKIFYLSNIIIPALTLIISSLFVPIESIVFALVIVHFILGIFTYFLAVIFGQGLKLQNEQELFI